MKKALSDFGHKVGSFFKIIWYWMSIVIVSVIVIAVILILLYLIRFPV